MAFFRRKADPISDRARALSSEIAALEAQIREYETDLERIQDGDCVSRKASVVRTPQNDDDDLKLEAIGGRQVGVDQELENDFVHVNDQGLQKYDLPRLLGKFRGLFRAPSTSNPKLVSYLAAGGIQGLRPLRYEKRVARNRFIVFTLILLVLLIGLLTVFLPK
jgi:hypothetical protein